MRDQQSGKRAFPAQPVQQIKDQIAESIRYHELKLSNEKTFQLSLDQSKTCRKQAVALTNLYYDDLPHWYRMVLNNRKEYPEGASKNLKALASNNRNPDHARSRIYNIKKNLNLSQEQAKG